MTDHHPWETHYSITDTTIIAETESLRVLEITLAPGEAVPWHYHSAIQDQFYPLTGALTVESRAPSARHDLMPGQSCVIDPKVAHLVTNHGTELCRFLLIQGVGPYDYRPVAGV